MAKQGVGTRMTWMRGRHVRRAEELEGQTKKKITSLPEKPPSGQGPWLDVRD